MATATSPIAPRRGLEAGRRTSHRHRAFGASSRGLAHRAVKNRTKYVYDGIYELTGVKYGVLSVELDNPSLGYNDYTTFTRKTDFAYDKVLNRKTVTDQVVPNPPVTTLYNHVGGVYTPDPMNEYYDIGGVANVHDNNGNLTDDGTFTYQYNFRNELLTATRKSDSVVVGRYNYDTLGRRVRKEASPAAQEIYDSIQDFLGQSDSLGNLLKKLILIRPINNARLVKNPPGDPPKSPVPGDPGDILIAVKVGAAWWFQHENTLSSVETITDVSGGNAEKREYEAFGKTTFLEWDGRGWIPPLPIGSKLTGSPCTFLGLLESPETSLLFDNTAYISPSEGRYLGQHASRASGIPNAYPLGANNPTGIGSPCLFRPSSSPKCAVSTTIDKSGEGHCSPQWGVWPLEYRPGYTRDTVKDTTTGEGYSTMKIESARHARAGNREQVCEGPTVTATATVTGDCSSCEIRTSLTITANYIRVNLTTA